MSTFKEISENTITNNGESISGRLVYNWLNGTESSKAVYFGLKDEAGNWSGNLGTKGTSAFYLTSNVSGCTAQVKDSTTSPTTADATTAREIWLNIPKATASRKILFSYNGITVLTVNQNPRTLYNVYIIDPVHYSLSINNIISPVYYLSMDKEYNEEYIARSYENRVNVQTNNYTQYFIALLDIDMNTFQGSINILDGTYTFKYLTDNYNLKHVSGYTYNFDGVIDNYICSFARGMYDSEQEYYINNLYEVTSYNGSVIYIWNPANMVYYKDVFICTGEFSVTTSVGSRCGLYTIEL